MKPIVTIVGSPNVGKSTLFNRLTRSRDALVSNMPGVTRDRLYGEGKVGNKPYMVVDTGGLSGDKIRLDNLMAGQVEQAINEADVILFLVDGRLGLSSQDEEIAKYLRPLPQKIFLCMNKTEGMDIDLLSGEFYKLGLGQPVAVSASHGDGVNILMDEVLPYLADDTDTATLVKSIKVSVIGRPNVGKSTLINRILGEDRVIAFDMPGTTRDSIYIPFERDGQPYTLIDTAGVRRRKNVNEKIEKFSIIKALQAIEDSHVVIMVMDAHTGISEQDIHLLGYVLNSGRALLFAVNKWDGLELDARERIKQELDRRLPFIDYAKMHFISALHGTGVGNLYATINKAYESAMRKLSTPELVELLQHAVVKHPPPIARGRRIKLRYAHQGGKNPPLIVIHGTQTDQLPDAYKRYLSKHFRESLELMGTPVQIELKNTNNPYAYKTEKKKSITPRQEVKRRKNKRFLKKKYGKKNKSD